MPRRYELRGAVITEAELGRLAGDPMLLVPSSRPSWKPPDQWLAEPGRGERIGTSST